MLLLAAALPLLTLVLPQDGLGQATVCDTSLFHGVTRSPAASLTRENFVSRVEHGDAFVLTDMFTAGFAPGLSNWSCGFLRESQDYHDVQVAPAHYSTAIVVA